MSGYLPVGNVKLPHTPRSTLNEEERLQRGAVEELVVVLLFGGCLVVQFRLEVLVCFTESLELLNFSFFLFGRCSDLHEGIVGLPAGEGI